MYRGERARIVAAAPAAKTEPVVDPLVEPELVVEPKARAPRRDRGVARGPRPPRAPHPEPEPSVVEIPALGGARTLAGLRVVFRHLGESSQRAFFVADERSIVLNLDHPETIASLMNGGSTSPFFAHYCYRTVLEEFTLAMVSDLGYPDAPEIAREIRERADKYARAFAPAILRFAFAEEEPS